MSKEIDLSIIVPVYNTARFLKQCILSLCKQDYDVDRFEIIVVDDGSQDESSSIVRNLQKDFANIIYIWQSNGRQGKARNTGIRHARGRYIAFLDSDDCWQYNNVISTLIPICDRQRLDILQSESFVNVNEDDEIQLKRHNFEGKAETYSRDEYLKLSDFSYSVAMSIYKTNIIKEEFFREKVTFEDSDWSISSIWRVGRDGKIGRICWPYYGYRSNPNSTTRKPRLSTYYDNVKGILSIVKLLGSYEDMDCSTRLACMGRVKRSVLSWIGISKNYHLRESLQVFSFAKREGILDIRFSGLSISDGMRLWALRYTLPRHMLLFCVRSAVLFKRRMIKWLKK